MFYKDKTIRECSDLCDQSPDCLAFEYGVDHQGTATDRYDERDCNLQNLAMDPEGDCDGQHYNLDLYVKKGNQSHF